MPLPKQKVARERPSLNCANKRPFQFGSNSVSDASIPQFARPDRSSQPARAFSTHNSYLSNFSRPPSHSKTNWFRKRQQMMKALLWHGTHDVRVDTLPEPKIQDPGNVIVKITSTAMLDPSKSITVYRMSKCSFSRIFS